MPEDESPGALRQLQNEVARLEKVVAALIARAETASDQLPSAFGVFQTTVLLEDLVRSRTREVNVAMERLADSNRALDEARAKFQAIFDLMPDPVALSSLDGRLLEVSRSFAEFFGYPPAAMVGRRTGPEDLSLWAEPADRERFLRQIEAGAGQMAGFECAARRKDGSLAHVSIASRSVLVEGARLLVTEFHDVTAVRLQGQRLRELAEHDALTGLPNRLLLLDRLQQAMAMARRHGSQLAVCFLDLDGFKAVNDQFGHQAGDLVLIETAHRLLASVRASDTACRIGGDEFALLLQGVAESGEFDDVLRRIQQTLRAPYTLDDGRTCQLGASVGFTIYPNDDAAAEVLISHADQAMYGAKRAGKNCARRFFAGGDAGQVNAVS